MSSSLGGNAGYGVLVHRVLRPRLERSDRRARTAIRRRRKSLLGLFACAVAWRAARGEDMYGVGVVLLAAGSMISRDRIPAPSSVRHVRNAGESKSACKVTSSVAPRRSVRTMGGFLAGPQIEISARLELSPVESRHAASGPAIGQQGNGIGESAGSAFLVAANGHAISGNED